MDGRRLNVLVELRRRGTITAVAEALAYSTSAVSQQLAQLEREVGVDLTTADGRRLRLTPAGELLADHAERLLRDWDVARADLARAAGEVSGTLRIAAFQTASLVLLPQLIGDLGARHPRLIIEAVQLERTDALSAVLGREVDLAIVESYPGGLAAPASGQVQQELFSDPMWLAIANDARLPEPQLSLRAVEGFPWVMEPRGTVARIWAEETCRRIGFAPMVRYETSDILVQRSYAERGLAAAFLPGLLWRVFDAPIRRVMLGEQSARTISTVTRPGHNQHPAVRAVRERLLEFSG